MARITCLFLLVLTCMIEPACGQPATPGGQPSLRGTRTMPPAALQSADSETSRSSANPSEPSPSRPAPARITPQVVPEAVTVIPVKEGENGYSRIVCPLNNLPVTSAAATLQNLFKAEGGGSSAQARGDKAVIVPETVGNCLLISGPPAAVEEVKRLLREIDRPAAMVRLEVRITETLSGKEKKSADAGSAESKSAEADSSKKAPGKTDEDDLLMYAEVTTLDNQSAYIQAGRLEPQITGVSQGPIGRTNNITVSNVGTKINITPRIGINGIVHVQLDIQDSRYGPIEEGALMFSSDKFGEVRQPNLDMLVNQTTLRLQDGQPMTISGTTSRGKTRKISVTAHLINPGGK